MLPSDCGEIAFVLALVLPFFLVTRWEGLGFPAAVLIGWLIVHFTNIASAPPVPDGDNARIDAVFKGVWLVFGPVFMFFWSAFASVAIWSSGWLLRGIKRITGSRLSPGTGD